MDELILNKECRQELSENFVLDREKYPVKNILQPWNDSIEF